LSYWAAVRCPPQRELVIAERLERAIGAHVYLPRARMRLGGSLRPVTAPLYRTYFFADLDLSPPWQAIRRQPGVIGLVMTGDAPSRCPESEILKLKAAEVDGVVRLASAPAPSRYRPSAGEHVRVRFGPLEGREGRYAESGSGVVHAARPTSGRAGRRRRDRGESRVKNHEGISVVASMGKHRLPAERPKGIDKIRRQEKKSPARKPETTRRRHRAERPKAS
jgi:transcription antitermination factor NusG